MYRLAHHSIRNAVRQQKKVVFRKQCKSFSAGPGSSGNSSNNNVLIGAGAIAIGVVGTVAYAQYDESFKSSLPAWLGGSKPAVPDILETPIKTSVKPIEAISEIEDTAPAEIEDVESALPIMDSMDDNTSDPSTTDNVAIEEEQEVTPVADDDAAATISEEVETEVPAVDTTAIELADPEPADSIAESDEEVATLVVADPSSSISDTQIENEVEEVAAVIEASVAPIEEESVAPVEEEAVEPCAVEAESEDAASTTIEPSDVEAVQVEDPPKEIESEENTAVENTSSVDPTDIEILSDVEESANVEAITEVESVDDAEMVNADTTEPDAAEIPAPIDAPLESEEEIVVSDEVSPAEPDSTPTIDPIVVLATVRQHLESCTTACNSAASSNDTAANAVARHSNIYQEMIHSASDEEKSTHLESLNAALSERDELLQEADKAYFSAVEELETTKKALESVPVKMDSGELNEELVNIERAWVNLSDTLENSRNKVNDSKSQSKITAYVTGVKVGGDASSQGLTLEEKAQILTYLQEYIDQLKQTIKETQEEGIRMMEEAVATAQRQTEEHERLVSARVLQNAMDDLNKDHDAEMMKCRQDFEQEMTVQLKRQAAAHAQHLADAISYQTEQLTQKHDEILKTTVANTEDVFRKELQAQKDKYVQEIEVLRDQSALAMEITTARVKGLSEALTGSAVYETESRKAQELALACDSLLHILKYGNNGKPVPLSKQIETVRKVCEGDETIETLTDAFSKVVSSRGVYTEDTLRTSFKQVGHLCRQVSLVDEEHSSLFVYFLSYLKNVLTFAPSTAVPPEEIDVSNLNPYNIVAYANYCLQCGDLEQAARFVNQLKGESRKVAEEWLLEARLLIETKQTTEALNMVSNAFVIAAQLSE